MIEVNKKIVLQVDNTIIRNSMLILLKKNKNKKNKKKQAQKHRERSMRKNDT